MSQKDFAKIFDVSQAIISRWEHGDCNFSLEKIAEIAVALDLDVNIYFSDVKSIKKRVAPFVRTIQSETFLTKAPSEKQYTPDVSVHNIISTSKEETSYASVC